MRLLFDENMSSSVAAALHLLEKDVAHVGAQSRPNGPRKPHRHATVPKRTPDPVVIERARQQGRTPVTSNYDFMLAATELGVQIVFVDPNGKSLTLFDTARMMFNHWDEWEAKLAAEPNKVLRATRHTATMMSFEEARQRAITAMQRQAAARSAKRRRRSDQPTLHL